VLFYKKNRIASFYNRRNYWMRRRWLDFRQGHTIYLVFAMTFLNFITIQYALLIKQVTFLQSTIFGNPWFFASVFIAVYVPLSIGIGYWHRKTQWKVEQEAMFHQNVVQARLWLFTINLIEGRATEVERKEMRELLEKILQKMPKEQPPRKKETEAA
jgi:hypothetical protein